MADQEDQLYDRMQDAASNTASDSMQNAGNVSRNARNIIQHGKTVKERMDRLQELQRGTKVDAPMNGPKVKNTLSQGMRTGVTQTGASSVSNAKHTAATAGRFAKSGGQAVARGVKKAAKTGIKAGQAAGKAAVKAGKALVKAAIRIGKALVDLTVATNGLIWVVIGVVFIIVILAVSIYVGINRNETKGNTLSYIDRKNTLGDHGITGFDDVIDARQDMVETLSPANAACYSYYTILSHQSVWQITDDGKLINATDENAKTDYFNRDDLLQLAPEFLYNLNDMVFGERMVYPEVFLQPVSYDAETMELILPVDEQGRVCVYSYPRDQYGIPLDVGEDEKIRSVADYGLGSVVTYQTEHITKVFAGTYIAEDYWDATQGCVVKRTYDTPETFSFVLEDQPIDVLDHMICMAGSIDFAYDSQTVVDQTVEEGSESASETDVVSKIRIGTHTETVYTGSKQSEWRIYSPNGQIIDSGFRTVYKTASEAYLLNNGYTVDYTTEETTSYNLYRYRSADSAVTTTKPVPKDPDTTYTDSGLDYYNAYMSHFEGYVPTGASRTYGALEAIQTSSESTASYGGGSNASVGSVTASQQEFIDSIAELATADMEESGILASVTMAQCIVESNWGQSGLSASYNNYFGMKAGSNWDGPTITMNTREQRADGSEYWVDADFCWFDSIESCFHEHSKFLWNTKGDDGFRYRDCVGVTDYREAITIIKEGGYATDTSYIDVLCNVIEQYDLTQYDTVWDGTPPEYAENEDESEDETDRAIRAFTKGLSVEDRERFQKFLHQFDDLPDGRTQWTLEKRTLTEMQRANILIYTRNFMYGTYYSEEDVFEVDMLTDGFINLMAKNRDFVTDGQVGMMFPTVDGFVTPTDVSDTSGHAPEIPVITSGYGSQESFRGNSAHKGVDLAGLPEGTCLYAIHDGTVLISNTVYDGSGTCGNWVVIEMADGTNYVYMHMRNPSPLQVGDRVKAGDFVGYMGTTGQSTGVHLHLQVNSTAFTSGSGDGGINAEDLVRRIYREAGITLQ